MNKEKSWEYDDKVELIRLAIEKLDDDDFITLNNLFCRYYQRDSFKIFRMEYFNFFCNINSLTFLDVAKKIDYSSNNFSPYHKFFCYGSMMGLESGEELYDIVDAQYMIDFMAKDTTTKAVDLLTSLAFLVQDKNPTEHIHIYNGLMDVIHSI